MKLVFTKTLVNNVYTVVVTTTEFAVSDTDLFAEFGEPTIAVGGPVSAVIATVETVLATLPITVRKVKSQFPYTIKFTVDDYSDPLLLAESWMALISLNVATAMDTLRLKTDNFTGVEETVI
jgi:hypothetical protein